MSARLRRHDAAAGHFGSAAFGVLLAVLVAPITGRMWRERGQRRLARMMPGLQDISPRILGRGWIDGSFSLECQTLQGYLIEVYIIMRGTDRVDSQNLFLQIKYYWA